MPTLDFKGKSSIYSHHSNLPAFSLKIDKKKSFSSQIKNTPSLDDNLIIYADNLYALKALLSQYKGKIKCIYIDPPYNTGNETWVFNDNVNSPLIKGWLEKNVGIGDLEKHDKWLCMMWPRLQLLRELLLDDGVIFVSIDDHEQFRLRAIMDEIFGEEHFIATIVKPTKIGGGNNTKHIVKSHEYIIVYAKNKELVPDMRVKYEKNYLQRYNKEDKKGRFFWDTLSRPGLRGLSSSHKTSDYDITAPDGTKIKGNWIRSKKRVEKEIQSGEIKIKKEKGKWTVHFKQRLPKGQKPRSLNQKLGGTIEGKKEIKEIFNDDRAFCYPKSSDMIKYLLESLNCPDAIVLDSFAGSGTTAHAVLDLNKEDGGTRKFILVECESYANSITAERVRRVIKGIPHSKNVKLNKGLGGSFTYCVLRTIQ